MKSNIFTKTFAKTKEKSPEILIMMGVAGIIVATVKACKASTKLPEVLDEHKEEVDTIKSQNMVVSEERKELATRYGKTAWELFRMYAPSAVIGGASICLIFKGHGILRQRYISLATTYGLLEKSYGTYRKRVVDELGEKMDEHFMYGTVEREEEVTEIDKKGKEKRVKKPITTISCEDGNYEVPKGLGGSPYARLFTPKSSQWQSNSFTLSLAYARQYEDYVNNLLIARPEKPVYLEEVYDWFDFEPTEASHDVGWMFDPNAKGKQASFNIKPVWVDIDGEWEEAVMMDFNCSDVHSTSYRRKI